MLCLTWRRMGDFSYSERSGSAGRDLDWAVCPPQKGETAIVEMQTLALLTAAAGWLNGLMASTRASGSPCVGVIRPSHMPLTFIASLSEWDLVLLLFDRGPGRSCSVCLLLCNLLSGRWWILLQPQTSGSFAGDNYAHQYMLTKSLFMRPRAFHLRRCAILPWKTSKRLQKLFFVKVDSTSVFQES